MDRLNNIERGKLIDELMLGIGEDVTIVSLNEALRKLGHRDANIGTYYVHRKKLFPHLNRSARSEARKERIATTTFEERSEQLNGQLNGKHDEPATPAERRAILEEPAVRHVDNVARFVKFACAVEAVGGVEAARAMLDYIEEMPGA